ncbi:MAG: DUF4129 domain-containing protein [Actinomycetes bacterium]
MILCWLALEEAASRTGHRRSDSQTPTEFTSEILDARRADPAATGELLSLYQRARFGTRPLPPDSVERARTALERIGSTLDAGPSTRSPSQGSSLGNAHA